MFHGQIGIALPIAVLLAAATAPAQWQPRRPGLPGLNDPLLAAAPHAGSQRIVLVGNSGHHLFDGRTFTPVAGPVPGRFAAAMTYDQARDRVVLFGGSTIGSSSALGDTWEFDGTRWTQRTPANAPSPRSSATLVYDRRRQVSVLVGGFVGGLGQGDTWEWNGQDWALRLVNAPGVRGGASGAYDPVHDLVCIHGGATVAGGPVRNDFWQFDGGGWQRVVTTIAPPARTDAAMTSDPWNGHLLLFGGTDAQGARLGDSWRWNGLAWSQVVTPTAPAPRRGHALVHDAARHQHVLFGGEHPGGAMAEVWTWSEDPRPVAVPFGSDCGANPLRSGNQTLPALGTTFALDTGVPQGLLFLALGFSDLTTALGPLPLALPGGCLLQVDPISVLQIVPGPNGHWPWAIPALPPLLGTRLYGQTLELRPAATNPLLTSNGLELRLGLADPITTTTAALDATTRDLLASAVPGAAVGGDGRHGAFELALGTALGNGVYELDTDHTVIPAGNTTTGVAAVVTDGQFYFTDLVIPAGITLRCRGTTPARLFVRGSARIDGLLDVNADPLAPYVPGWGTALLAGQGGGRGGPGGASGGDGAERCQGFGPLVVNGVRRNDGVRGSDARLAPNHPQANAALGTGGPGAPLHPAHGQWASLQFQVLNALNGDLSAGGGGGGLRTPGGQGTTQPIATGVVGSANVAGGTSFALGAPPGGWTSLDWFSIGGAGGGGGGSHSFTSTAAMSSLFRGGGGGGGGGGVLAVRCGGDLAIGATGRIEARGGSGSIFASLGNGLVAPGGGGSGGSVLLQTSGTFQNLGLVDARGGTGGAIQNLPTFLTATSRGGDGGDGILRFEAPLPIVAGATQPPVVASDLGPLLDRDARSGLRSIWLPVAPPDHPGILVRYELDLLVNGTPVRYSDDPAIGPGLDDPNGAIVARFQACGRDASGQPDAARRGAWRRGFGPHLAADTCYHDLPAFVRIDLTYPTSTPLVVQGLRFLWH